MNKIISISLLLFLLGNATAFAQAKKDAVKPKDTLKSVDIDPLTPAKAAFYSAILPGLGQAYNKRYWKIPIVYGAMGTSLYLYIDNKKNTTNIEMLIKDGYPVIRIPITTTFQTLN